MTLRPISLTRQLLIASVGLSLFSGMIWGQANEAPAQQPAAAGADNNAVPPAFNPDADRMTTPPPLNGLIYPITLGSQERSNYLRTALSFTSGYTDNLLGGTGGHPVSDITYSVAPVIGLDETTTRMHLLLNYAPGYTFYQKTSARNEADQDASVEFGYRLSPHVTLSAHDSFQKSSNVFNQSADLAGGVVPAGIQTANASVIPPFASYLNNSGNVGISYQFGLNDMVGASGAFSNLYFLDSAQAPGLADSSSQGGLAFYSHRFGQGQYLGLTYSFQRLLSFPTFGKIETMAHAPLGFYSFTPASSKISISFFGGPQYSDTTLPFPLLAEKSWGGTGGTSLGWQGRLTSLALSYAHVISGGGGLSSAVHQDSGSLSVRQQIVKTLNASVTGAYAQNNAIGSAQLGTTSGHSISGSASIHQTIGEHIDVTLEYARIHQSYSGVQAFSASTPDTKHESISISYHFSRPLGR